MSDDELVPAYYPVDFLEADAIRQHLSQLGIFCHLEGEQQGSLAGSGFFGNAGRWRSRLLVRRKDLEQVQQIIEAHDWPKYT